jgi:hypothetical protein
MPFPIFLDMVPGGLGGRLFVECYDWDPDGSFDLIGEFRCTLGEFLDGKRKHYFINPKKKKYRSIVCFVVSISLVFVFMNRLLFYCYHLFLLRYVSHLTLQSFLQE